MGPPQLRKVMEFFRNLFSSFTLMVSVGVVTRFHYTVPLFPLLALLELSYPRVATGS